MITKNLAFFSLLTGALWWASLSDAMASKGETVPGTYRDWNREIDQVAIIQSFRLDTYTDIAVESFDTSKVALPNPKENTRAAVQSAMGSIKPAFMEGFQTSLRKKPGAEPRPARGEGKALVIRVHVIKLDPGSQAARYWASFGAGAVKVAVNGEVVDGSSGKTLVRFNQERRSGVGLFGGGYSELFSRTARQIGGDVAGLLNAF